MDDEGKTILRLKAENKDLRTITHMPRDRRRGIWVAVPMLLAIGCLLLVTGLAFKAGERDQHTHPAADGIVTRAEIAEMLVKVNREHARMRAAIEAVDVRVDRLLVGVKAMAPQMDGRSRVPELIEEAGR